MIKNQVKLAQGCHEVCQSVYKARVARRRNSPGKVDPVSIEYADDQCYFNP